MTEETKPIYDLLLHQMEMTLNLQIQVHALSMLAVSQGASPESLAAMSALASEQSPFREAAQCLADIKKATEPRIREKLWQALCTTLQ